MVVTFPQRDAPGTSLASLPLSHPPPGQGPCPGSQPSVLATSPAPAASHPPGAPQGVPAPLPTTQDSLVPRPLAPPPSDPRSLFLPGCRTHLLGLGLALHPFGGVLGGCIYMTCPGQGLWLRPMVTSGYHYLLVSTGYFCCHWLPVSRGYLLALPGVWVPGLRRDGGHHPVSQ